MLSAVSYVFNSADCAYGRVVFEKAAQSSMSKCTFRGIRRQKGLSKAVRKEANVREPLWEKRLPDVLLNMETSG